MSESASAQQHVASASGLRAAPLRWLLATFALLLAAWPAAAQLDSSCVVTALNRGAQVRDDGSFWISQIPADVGLVRVRATCVREGVTLTGASPFFDPVADGLSEVPDIVLDDPPLVPSRLTVTSPLAELAAPGDTLQLTTVADYPDGTSVDVTAIGQGTAYSISNTAIASVDDNGLVTAVSGGTALISAFNEGALGVVLVRVAFPAGEDSDGDGIPDSVEIALGLDPNDPIDGFQDLDDDGLANVDELALGTDAQNPDSDGDGILDGEEVEIGVDGFETNPLLADTDGDLLRDGLEIQIGTDPTDPASFDFGAALAGLTVAPDEILLPRYLGDPPAELTRQLTVRGDLIDGQVVDLTSALRGTSYASSDLLVCGFTATDGEILAGNDGACDVTVTNGAFSAVAAIEVRTLPRRVGSLELPGFANDVAVDAGLAFVAGGSAGLLVIDVSDPTAPVLVGTADTSGSALEVEVDDGVAYVADDGGGLVIVDVSVPSAPAVLATVSLGGRSFDVAAGDGLALVAGSLGLAVVDVSTPAAPQLLTQYLPPTGGAARAVARRASDGLVAVATRAADQIAVSFLDLSDAANPVLLGAVEPATGQAYGLGFLGDRIVLGGLLGISSSASSGLVEIDVADPAAPAVLASVPRLVSGLAYDVAVDEGLAFVADIFFNGTVPIVDLVTPGQPTPAAYWTYNNRRGNGHGIAAGDGLIFLAQSDSQDPFRSNGESLLLIGQYVPRPVDTAGIAPSVTLTQPQAGQLFVGGRTITFAADATDDVAVASVSFFASDVATGVEELVGVDTAAPYAVELTLPAGPTSLDLRVVARDTGGSLAEDAIRIDVALNQPPTVTLTAPADGASFFDGDLIEMLADAADPDGTIASVEFFVNGALRSTDTALPYRSSVFGSVDEPTLVIEAVATDDLGATASDQLTVTVVEDPPPMVTILQPAEGVSAVAEMPLFIALEVTDNEPLSAVSIQVDGTTVFDSPAPPYEVTFDVPVATSELVIDVIARDRAFQVTNVSRTVPVVPSDPPTVALTSPAAGDQAIAGGLLVLEATAADDVGVSTVELLIDGAVVATLSETPYRFDATVPTGVSTLTASARATDTAGQVTLSDAVVVTVLPSAPPMVTLTSPADGAVVVAGETVAVTAAANDDVGVTAVRFRVAGALAATDTTPPYGFDLVVPPGEATLELVAEAEDGDGQVVSSAPVVLEVAASDGTAISGRVVDAAGDAVGGADVTCGETATTSAGDGSFLITGLPVDQGDFVCRASVTLGAQSFFGSSPAIPPVPDGTADAGDITLGEVALISGGVAVQQVDPASGDLDPLYLPSDPDESPIAVAVREDGFLWVVNNRGELQVIDAERGTLVGNMGIPWSANADRVRLGSIAVDPRTGVAYGVSEFALPLFRLGNGGEVTELGSTGLEDGSSLAFAADGTLYQVGSSEAVLQVLDTNTGAPLQTIALAQGYRAFAIDPVSGTAYVATSEQLSTLDLTTGEVTAVAGLATSEVSELTFGVLVSDEGTTVVGSVQDEAGGPIAGATVRCRDQVGVSAADGSFVLTDVASLLGSFRCRAVTRDVSGERLRGSSSELTPASGGTTDAGVLTVRSVGPAHYPGIRFPAGADVAAVATGDLDGNGLDDVVAALTSNEIAVMLATGPSTLGPAQRYASGSGPVHVAVADLDADGNADVVTVNQQSRNVSVRLGAGDGTLLGDTTYAVGNGPAGVAVADFDLDGALDLVVANADSRDLSVLYGTGSGGFAAEQRLALSISPSVPSVSDVNGDGRPDLVLADGRGFSQSFFTVLAGSDGSLQIGPTVAACCTVTSAIAADLDGDGASELIGRDLEPGGLIVATGRGDGTFDGSMRFSVPSIETEIFFGTAALVAGDFTGDGRQGVAFIDTYQATLFASLPLGGLGERRHFPLALQPVVGNPGGGGGEGLRDAALKEEGGEGEIGSAKGSASGQLDGDGAADLAIAITDEVGLFFGADSVAVPDVCIGSRFLLADLNADGNDDLLAWTCQGGVVYQLSDGDGGLGAVRVLDAFSARDVAVGDLDEDGIVDLAVIRSNGEPLLFKGLGGGSFAPAVSAPSASTRSDLIVIGDFDGDSQQDLAVSGEVCGEEEGCSPELSMMSGNGDLTFQPRTTIDLSAAGAGSVDAMIVADLNGDDRDDLLTGNVASSNMTVVRSLPSGDFLRFSVPTFGATTGVGTADFDRDGRVDLVAAAGTGGLGLAFANTTGTWNIPIELPIDGSDIRGVAVVDIDDDGFEDLLAIDHPTDQVLVLRGRGDGTFETVQKIGVGSRPMFLTAGDLDGDGRPDFVVRGEGIPSNIGGALTLRSLGVVRHH